jgi:hypothetical protein
MRDPGGQDLLGVESHGEKTGNYEVSISDRKFTLLLLGAVTFGATFARAAKSSGRPGCVEGPLCFSSVNGYDVSRDLSTIVYARPGGHAGPIF